MNGDMTVQPIKLPDYSDSLLDSNRCNETTNESSEIGLLLRNAAVALSSAHL